MIAAATFGIILGYVAGLVTFPLAIWFALKARCR